MSQLYDISSKITNETPSLKITDDIILTINNRMKNILNVRAIMEDASKKNLSEMEMMDKAMELLVGVKKYKEVKELNLPISSYTTVFNTIMQIATGEYKEDNTPK